MNVFFCPCCEMVVEGEVVGVGLVFLFKISSLDK